MQEITVLRQEMQRINETLRLMSRSLGTRLSREQVCVRLCIHRNTLARYIRENRFPAPDTDGHWQLATVMAWEESQATK